MRTFKAVIGFLILTFFFVWVYKGTICIYSMKKKSYLLFSFCVRCKFRIGAFFLHV